jgi:ATP-dependent helicase Lhr and Lhr-like helicase
VTAFERLNPAVQHHVVNALGWRSLRPLQEAAIEPIRAGAHVLLCAPTAGGKTEAALLPLLSRMADEDWSGLSVLYVCPLRALLNDLLPRVESYASWLGRTAAVWHLVRSAALAEAANRPPVDPRRVAAVKFAFCVPEPLLAAMLAERDADERAVDAVLKEPVLAVSR